MVQGTASSLRLSRPEACWAAFGISSADGVVVMNRVIFPPVVHVTVDIFPDLQARFEDLVRDKDWKPEEAARILLAYGAETLAGHRLSSEETYNEWAAARAEYAVLRHRAYTASEAIRTMKMNISGLQPKNAQYKRSLQQQYARRERLRQALGAFELQRHAPVPPTPGADDAP
jgi:hypothetical protein